MVQAIALQKKPGRRIGSGLVLGILAAIVPILASTWVAGSVLVEHARAAHAARVYARVWERFNEERAQLKADGSLPADALRRRQRELNARRMRLLELNGLDPMSGSLRALGDSVKPKPPSAAEQARQWVLLLGSVAGVVLLALSLITGA